MPPGVPVAMPYEPQERMAPCAGAAGGWQTPRLGAAKGHDVRAATTATDAPGPTPPGTRHGGCVPQQSARPAQASILASATPCWCYAIHKDLPRARTLSRCHHWLPRSQAHAVCPRKHADVAAQDLHALLRGLGVGTREREGKGRAVPLDTLHRNLARMRGENLPHNIEA